MAIVYLVTNKTNGKRYVGVTSKTLERRRVGHHWDARHGRQTMFAKALRKYGLTAFDWVIVRDYLFADDAIAAEERLIASSRPEYNISAGGVGVKGLRHTEATKAKMRASHTAERRAKASILMSRLAADPEFRRRSDSAKKGMKHKKKRQLTPAISEAMRKRGLARMDVWRDHAAMGPKSVARPVVCLDDGKVYESASAAARAYCVAKSALIELCLGKKYRKTVGGHRFRYAEN